MKTAINYWTIGGFENTKPIEKALDEARKMGYQGLELTFGAGALGEDTPEKELIRIRNYAKKTKMAIPSLASGFFWGCSLSSPVKKEREKAIAFTKKYIHAASVLNAGAVLVIPGYVHIGWDENSAIVPYETAWKLSQDSIKQILPVASREKVIIAIENVWNKFLLSPREMREFIDSFKSKWVGSYFDPANVSLTGFPEHWIQILGKRIKRVHVKNFKGQDAGGTIKGFGEDILEGDVNWPLVVKELKKIKYNGFLTAELLPFCRLPDMVLPDLELARKNAGQIKSL
ncbi:MAG: sugar phosphate isomerase/epimerase [Candidatus Omnitrophica bacterium]|nr:sugar phosphate isomerase/epimerase [Candidatus Omnitrophota bacterium]